MFCELQFFSFSRMLSVLVSVFVCLSVSCVLPDFKCMYAGKEAVKASSSSGVTCAINSYDY